MPLLVLALGALAGAALFSRGRARLLFPIAAAALVVALVGRSELRLVGDGGEYLMMSLNLARLAPPSMGEEDAAIAATYLPANAQAQLANPEYLGRDGRQDLPHFWFYSLLAAPFVRLSLALGVNPLNGFLVLNGLLLLGATLALDRWLSPVAASFLVLGPVLWWVDKAHTEVFTVSLLAVAFALLATRPWWSIVALGAAATQNPPIAAAMILLIAFAMVRARRLDARVLAASAAGLALAALHPLYYHRRLGIWTGLTIGVDRHWPSSSELMAALVDPNLGIFVHDPLILIAAAGAVLVALTRRPSRLSDMRHLVTLAVAVLFAVAFTQTGNFNSGGTPGPSRYGLWLLPLAIPVIASSASTMWVRGLAVASILWCSAHFAPAAPESYLHPTALAERLWDRNPEVDNPLAEVFAERVSGQEPPPKPPIATTGCEKVLVAGDGMRVGWPSRCDAIVPNAPSECRENGALCYANKLLTTYTFKRAPASPSWIVWQQTPGVMETSVQAPAQQAGLAVPPAQRPQPTLWLTDGWSYLEHDIGAPRDAATWRWMGDRAQLDVVMPAAGRARVRLVLRAFTKTRRLRISLGGKAVATLPITEGLHGYQTEPIDFAAGSNALVFESLDGSEMPGPKDTRRLSIALYHADVEP